MSLPLIYFFRHGQTDWNAEQRFQGQRDIPLNETGRTQAAANGRTLASLLDDPLEFDFVSSPLSRTRQTMEIVRAELGLPQADYKLEPRIIEIDFGDWEGQTIAELGAHRSHELHQRAADKWNYIPAGGENYAVVHDRVVGWLDTVQRRSVVSCHGGILRSLMHHLVGLSQEEASMVNIPQDRIFRVDGTEAAWL